MHWTLSITSIPASRTAVLLVGIFMNPAMFGGGGSPSTHYNTGAPWFQDNSGLSRRYKCSSLQWSCQVYLYPIFGNARTPPAFFACKPALSAPRLRFLRAAYPA